MDLERKGKGRIFGHGQRERERERELGEFRRKRAWKIWVGSNFLLGDNMSLSSNVLFGYQESLRKIEKITANNFFLIFKLKKNQFKWKLRN